MKNINIVNLSKNIFKSSDENINKFKVQELIDVLPFQSEGNTKRINLLIPSINREHVFGGIYTAIKIFELLSNYFDKSRVLVVDFVPSTKNRDFFCSYEYLQPNKISNSPHQIVSLASSKQALLPVEENDLFFATIWYTAYFAQRLIKWQSEKYNLVNRKIVYLIQDYEPSFYSYSSQYLLAQSTYKYKHSTIAIYNSSLLKNYFNFNNIFFDTEYIIEPHLSKPLTSMLSQFNERTKRKQILIYGRPSTPRNLFSLILEILNIWADIYPESDQWKLFSAGELHSHIDIKKGVSLRSLGKLSLEEYAEYLSYSSIGISLMASPHPSYPPLEMAHYGVRVLTNNFENKDLSKFHDNIVSLNDFCPEAYALKLKEMCESYCSHKNTAWSAKSHLENYLFEGNEYFFLEELAHKLIN